MPPRFSVLTTVYEPEPEHLRACLDSVDEQTNRSWEHVIVDDGSQRAGIAALLDDAERDPRRVVIRRHVNGGIVDASNDALAAASGEFVVLLDHDDVLTPDALSTVAERIDSLERGAVHASGHVEGHRAERDGERDVAHDGAHDVVNVFYSDHDLLRPDGRCASPMYKPDFSLERLRNHNYITHLVVARRTTVNDVGGFRPGFDGAQDHDLLLRLAEVTAPFEHISKILLHWRQSPSSVASDSMNKPDAYDRGCRAVADHLERCGIDASTEVGALPGIVRIRRTIAARAAGGPRVSVIVPTRGTKGRVWGAERIFVHEAVRSLLAEPGPNATETENETDAEIDFEIVVVVDDGTDPLVERGLRRIAGDRLVVVNYSAPYNFADKINCGVEASTGEFVLLLNDDTEVIAADSVAEMVGLAQDPSVGMVGAKLLFEDGRLQHGGHVYNGMISHALLHWSGTHPGPYRLLSVARECSGVTAAAALLRRDVFDEVGGMNTDFAVNYNDVDFSLRVRSTGRSIIWTPHASWYHFEQQSGAHPIDRREIDLIQARWGDALENDPYYNTNLAPGRCDWLELPLASGAPPYEILDDGRVAWS